MTLYSTETGNVGRTLWRTAGLALVFLVFLAFYRGLFCGFTNYDDDYLLIQNPLIRDLSFSGIGRMFTPDPDKGLYIPLVYLSYAIEYRFFGLNPFAVHLTNQCLHAGCALLVLFIVARLGCSVAVAFLTACLFAVHPLRVESVVWAAERKDVLYAFFYLGAIAAFIWWRQRPERRHFWLCVLLCLLSCLSKTSAVTLPVVFFLLDLLYFGKRTARSLVQLWPFWSCSVFFVGLTYFTFHTAEKAVLPASLGGRAAAMVLSLAFYIEKFFSPVKLCCFYPFENDPSGGRLAAAVMLAAGFFWVTLRARRSKPLLFGLLFFLFSVAPLMAVPFFYRNKFCVADRYSYVASVGLALAASQVISNIWNRSTRMFARGSVLFGVVVWIACLVGLSWERCPVWQNSQSLWKDALVKFPGLPIAYGNLGQDAYERQDYRRALDNFNEAVRLDPAEANFFAGRSAVYIVMNENDKARRDLEKALTLAPNHAAARYNRAVLYLREKEPQKAIEVLTELLSVNSFNAEALLLRGTTYLEMGQDKRAYLDMEAAAAADPKNPLPYFWEGWLLDRLKLTKEAAASYRRFLALGPVGEKTKSEHARKRLVRIGTAVES